MADQYMSTLTPQEVDQALLNIAQVNDKVAQAEQAAQQAQQYAESINPANFVQASVLVDLIYPVGSIYMSANNVSPQTFLGGTWTQIQSRFLLAADSATYPAGSTGGEATVSLTGDQNGPHQHSGITVDGTPLSWSYPAVSPGSGTTGTLTNQGTQVPVTGSAGSGAPHNNMPPYLAVYMWKRTA